MQKYVDLIDPELCIEYLLIKIGVDTAENEPAKSLTKICKCCSFRSYSYKCIHNRQERGRTARGAGAPRRPGGRPRCTPGPRCGSGGRSGAAGTRVERFGRRGTEPFELFRSEFGQNSGIVAKIYQKFLKKSGIIMFNIF